MGNSDAHPDAGTITAEGWVQLEALYLWIRKGSGERVAGSWLAARRLPSDLVDEVLAESFSVLLDWVRRKGLFDDFEPGRLATFAITQRGGPNVVRRRTRQPAAPSVPGGMESAEKIAERLPADIPDAVERTPDLALLALSQEYERGAFDAQVYAATQYFLNRHFGRLDRPSWLDEDPAGGTTDIEKLVWETYQYVSGDLIDREAGRIPPVVRDRKRRLWREMEKVLRRILA